MDSDVGSWLYIDTNPMLKQGIIGVDEIVRNTAPDN